MPVGTTVFPGQLGSSWLQTELSLGSFFVSPVTASPVSLQTSFGVADGYSPSVCCCQHGFMFGETGWCLCFLHAGSGLHKAIGTLRSSPSTPVGSLGFPGNQDILDCSVF